MESNLYPIYIKAGCLLGGEGTQTLLSKITRRPVVMVHGDPKDCVLDTFESVRDKLAGQALPAVLINFTERSDQWDRAAEMCYEIADAMIAESMKRKDKVSTKLTDKEHLQDGHMI